ncbi:MAG: alpha/beta hydrolase family protein [Ruminococcus sp.]
MKKKHKIIKITAVVLVALTVLFCIASMVLVKLMFNDNFSRGELDEYTTDLRYSDIEEDYSRTPVNFYSGENKLQGYIYGEDNNKALLVLAHGIGGGHEEYTNVIKWFVDKGYRVFAYDCTGSVESEGEGTMGLSQSAIDLDAALTYIENDAELSKMKKVLLGHSWGGYAVTAGLNFDHDVAASAGIAGYAEPVEMITEWGERILGGFVYAEIPFIWLNNKLIFGDMSDLSAIDGINRTDTPVLIVHGTEDKVIEYNGASIISNKDRITNPNVRYITVSDEKINGHNSIFYSQNAMSYLEELDKQYQPISDKYGDEEVPDEINDEFYAAVDKERANELNEKLFNEINDFYEQALNTNN